MPAPIQYTIEVNRRSRHVRLKIHPDGALVVVIPDAFDPRRVPAIVAEKADWINRTRHKMARQPHPVRPELAQSMPGSILLPATGETWQVEYIPSRARGITLTHPARHTLRLTGNVASRPLCRAALRRWVNRLAKSILPPELNRLAREIGCNVGEISIRNQRTRWGSCSRHNAISLNQKLVFLPPGLVRYVMLHELCHTRVMAHSKKFWELVGHYDPDYRKKIKELRASARYLPVWA